MIDTFTLIREGSRYKDTLCLRNELVKFTYETFENKSCSSALGHFNIVNGHTAYKDVRVWRELGKFEDVGRDILRSFWVLQARRESSLNDGYAISPGNHSTPED